MHVSDNFLLQFQDEANRYIDIYHFGIEPVDFQTPLTLELLSKAIINPDCSKGKYPHVNVVDKSVSKLFETCSSEEKQNNLQIVKTYNNLYACVYTKVSRDVFKCALQVKKKKAKGGEFISPMLNISKAKTPINVQFYINTVLQRIVCIPLANCLYTSMYISSKCFLKAFENCKNHERLPTLHMLATKKVHEKAKDKDVKCRKHLTQPCIKILKFL